MRKFVIDKSFGIMKCFDEGQNATVLLYPDCNDIEVKDGDFTDPDLDSELNLNIFYTELKRRLLIIHRTTNYYV